MSSHRDRNPTASLSVMGWLALTVTACSSSPSNGETDGPQLPEAPDTASTCAEWLTATAVGEVDDPSLNEISGIVTSRTQTGVLWIIEDSGADPVVTALDHTGNTLGSVVLNNTNNVDWEDLAIGRCNGIDSHTQTQGDCLWIADIGDNKKKRDRVHLFRIIEPNINNLSEQTPHPVDATKFTFTYAEGPQNAESLVLTPEGEPVVLTKRKDRTAAVYRLGNPSMDTFPSPSLSGLISTTELPGQSNKVYSATGADLSPDGRWLILRTYSSIQAYPLQEGDVESADQSTAMSLPAAMEIQGESVAYDPVSRGIWQVSEGVRPTLYFLPCR